ncbi:MAG: nitroreductase [Anaerolineales bacterium]|nr:nitroreductase [Anaerolineales bacterium]
MDVLEAIYARHAVRDFAPTSVPKETVIKILTAATRAPSGGNGQPWELFVASGATMEAIRKGYVERAQGAPPRPPSPRPESTSAAQAAIRERMTAIRIERMRLLGLDPDDPEAGKMFLQMGARLWGTPVLVVVCMDQTLSANMDLGMLVQSICLAAQGHGLESLIAAGLVTHLDILRKELEIPENLNIVIGIGLGYATDHLINTYRSPRRPIEEVVRYKD